MRHTQIIVEITVILGQNMHYCGKCWLLKSVLIEKNHNHRKLIIYSDREKKQQDKEISIDYIEIKQNKTVYSPLKRKKYIKKEKIPHIDKIKPRMKLITLGLYYPFTISVILFISSVHCFMSLLVLNEKLRAVNIITMYRLNTKCVPRIAYAIEFSTSVLYVSIAHLYRAPAATSVKNLSNRLYVLYLPFVKISLSKSTC